VTDDDRTERRDEDRITVRRRTLHLCRSDSAARAGLVLYDKRLTVRFLQFRRDHSRDHVGRTAGRKGHKQRHRLTWPRLADRRCRYESKEHSCNQLSHVLLLTLSQWCSTERLYRP